MVTGISDVDRLRQIFGEQLADQQKRSLRGVQDVYAGRGVTGSGEEATALGETGRQFGLGAGAGEANLLQFLGGLGQRQSEFGQQFGLQQELGRGQLGLGQQQFGLQQELGRGQLGLGQQQFGLQEELGRGSLGLQKEQLAAQIAQQQQQFGLQEASLFGGRPMGAQGGYPGQNQGYGGPRGYQGAQDQQGMGGFLPTLQAQLGLGQLGIQQQQWGAQQAESQQIAELADIGGYVNPAAFLYSQQMGHSPEVALKNKLRNPTAAETSKQAPGLQYNEMIASMFPQLYG